MTDDFTDEQRGVLAKVEKLMRLAAKNPNENEAAAASAKAMDLLAAYNLTTAMLEAASGDTGKRAEEKLVGGFYQYERDLWSAIAELNFVWYFSRQKYVKPEERKAHRGRIYTQQHVLIGRTVNIAATKGMASYLLGTIERLTREKTEVNKVHPRSSWAVSFRRGVAERVQEKVNRRRWDLLDEERRTAAEAAEKAREAGVNSVSSGQALTLSSVKQAEHEGNYDFIHGEGAYAKMKAEVRAEKERRAKAQAAAEAAYTAWAAANPEEAARDEAKRIKEDRARSNRRGRSYGRAEPAFKGDWSAYRQGREVGEKVGIDLQAEGVKVRGALK